jgi:hypothetical protein
MKKNFGFSLSYQQKRWIRQNKFLSTVIGLTICIVLFTSAKMMIPSNQPIHQFLKEAGFNNVPSVVGNAISAEKTYWQEEYGLHFLTNAEMDTLMKANKFMMGNPSDYIAEIPDTAARTMRKNYNKIDNEFLTYAIQQSTWSRSGVTYLFSSRELGWNLRGEIEESDNDQLFFPDAISWYVDDDAMLAQNMPDLEDWEMTRVMSNANIRIVAPSNKFRAGAVPVGGLVVPENKHPDPIAVIPHRNGWVILAKW